MGLLLKTTQKLQLIQSAVVGPVLNVPQFAHITFLHELLLLPTFFSATIYSTDYYL